MKKKKVVYPFRIEIEQKKMLEKLGLKKSQFIRDAITEKFEREPYVFK